MNEFYELPCVIAGSQYGTVDDIAKALAMLSQVSDIVSSLARKYDLSSSLADSIEQNDQYNKSPVVYAAAQGDLDIFNWLITKTNPTTTQKNDALLKAVTAGQLTIVNYYLENLPDDFAKDFKTTLAEATNKNRTPVVKFLLEHMPVVLSSEPLSFVDFIVTAIKNNNPEIFSLFMQRITDKENLVSVKTSDKLNLLQLAIAKSTDFIIIKDLISACPKLVSKIVKGTDLPLASAYTAQNLPLLYLTLASDSSIRFLFDDKMNCRTKESIQIYLLLIMHGGVPTQQLMTNLSNRISYSQHNESIIAFYYSLLTNKKNLSLIPVNDEINKALDMLIELRGSKKLLTLGHLFDVLTEWMLDEGLLKVVTTQGLSLFEQRYVLEFALREDCIFHDSLLLREHKQKLDQAPSIHLTAEQFYMGLLPPSRPLRPRPNTSYLPTFTRRDTSYFESIIIDILKEKHENAFIDFYTDLENEFIKRPLYDVFGSLAHTYKFKTHNPFFIKLPSIITNLLQTATSLNKATAVGFLLKLVPKFTIEFAQKYFFKAAAISGSKQVVDVCLKLGANVKIVDEKNQTALIIAVRNNNQDLIAPLVAYGVPINARDEGGMSALDYAAAHDKEFVYIKELFKLKAELAVQSIQILLKNDNLAVFTYLDTNQHLNVMQYQYEGYPITYWALKHNALTISRYILDNYFDEIKQDFIDDLSNNWLQLAKHAPSDIFKYFIKMNISFAIHNAYGQSIFDALVGLLWNSLNRGRNDLTIPLDERYGTSAIKYWNEHNNETEADIYIGYARETMSDDDFDLLRCLNLLFICETDKNPIIAYDDEKTEVRIIPLRPFVAAALIRELENPDAAFISSVKEKFNSDSKLRRVLDYHTSYFGSFFDSNTYKRVKAAILNAKVIDDADAIALLDM